ncbi:hypothetical protein Baya_15946 [Bagarius yarrelli]|uniref:Uncharacterized protein n=1 Tax=Bagarius yarrelli TaxID=175774 RepID=A0A556VU69_BAGYA|nr:hypothetical protein Baya_15946 [Bagarius yarrelli]
MFRSREPSHVPLTETLYRILSTHTELRLKICGLSKTSYRWRNYRRVSAALGCRPCGEKKLHVSAIDREIFGVGHFRDLTKFLTVFLCEVSNVGMKRSVSSGRRSLGVSHYRLRRREEGQNLLR